MQNRLLKVRCQKGISLIELMIALLLGALLMFGIFQIFDSNRQTSQVTTAFSRVQEGGRISMEMMVRDIRLTDHWGCTPGPADITSHLVADADYVADLDPTSGNAIFGEDDVTSLTVGAISVKDNSDTLTLKGANRVNTARLVPPYITQADTKIHITAGVTLPANEVYLIGDCNKADLFTNTSTTAGEVNYGAATITGAPDNNTVAISENYVAHAQLLSPWSKKYFIGQPTAGVWSLYWQANGGAPEELVRDIQDMQIQYGVDTSGNGSVDVFSSATAGLDWDAVISVRVTITADSSNSAAGDLVSRNYTVTGNIRNRSL